MKWINIKDQLPEDDTYILINMYREDKNLNNFAVVQFKNNRFIPECPCISEYYIDDCYWPITHWAPILNPMK